MKFRLGPNTPKQIRWQIASGLIFGCCFVIWPVSTLIIFALLIAAAIHSRKTP